MKTLLLSFSLLFGSMIVMLSDPLWLQAVVWIALILTVKAIVGLYAWRLYQAWREQQRLRSLPPPPPLNPSLYRQRVAGWRVESH